ncbi:Mediator of RNA polymerase II transcription subunit 23 [Clarias magur]|uniref:Mediator of RNA polymerase II transcription subunit 23 n=1 Tax=Clarias magur TaxID=1594786 RepID=A0A8J4UTY7_CLAMG|nr:Mediator of RNA polymerase II transcription subunit 23 [Clarias magur]
MLLVLLLPFDWATSIQMAHERHILQTLERRAPFDSSPDATHERRRQDVLPKKEHQQHALHLSAIKALVHVKCLPLRLS